MCKYKMDINIVSLVLCKHSKITVLGGLQTHCDPMRTNSGAKTRCKFVRKKSRPPFATLYVQFVQDL